MGVTRRYYTDEYKQEAVKLAESVRMARAAKNLGDLSAWNIKRLKMKEDQSPVSSSLTDKDKEILRLKKENRHLLQINEVLFF